jgi:hypothetical protein
MASMVIAEARESALSQSTPTSTPKNPFLLDGSIQPIIHYDCGQSVAIDAEMWSGHRGAPKGLSRAIVWLRLAAWDS